MTIQKGDKKLIRSWAFYDWANSVYSLVITSAIFPVYYNQITTESGSDVISFYGYEIINTTLYAYCISGSFLLVALFSPLLSSIADYSGKKKGFMKFFAWMGALSCSALYFFDEQHIEYGIICSFLASIGYSGSIVFYNAYLPEIAELKDHDRVSAKGFSYGYIGSVILLTANILLMFILDDFKLASRISFLSVGVWWFGFSLITFSALPKNIYARQPSGNVLLNGYRELLTVLGQLKDLKYLKWFLAAFFFFIGGVQTVMYMAASYGHKELQLDQNILILTILIIQLVAVAGAYGFSRLSGNRGNIFALVVSLLIWIGVCVGVYFVHGTTGFIVSAVFVGLVMGGIQSLARSTYSKMLPETHDHASYFSFYDVMEKLATVGGTFLFGYMEGIYETMRTSVFAIMILFIIGLLLLLRIPNRMFLQNK